MTGFLDRLGDRVNPIVVKECRQAVGSRLVSGLLLLFLVVQFGATAAAVSGRDYARDAGELNLRAGREVFTFVQGCLLVTCLLFIPLLAGGRLANERSDVNVDLLFISSLSPRAIVAGKLTAAAALALLIFSACAPFMAFAYVLRGLDVPTIASVLVIDFVTVLLGTTLALVMASVPVNRGLRVLLGLVGVGGLVSLLSAVLAGTQNLLQSGFRYDTTAAEFWAGFAGAVAVALLIAGLMFVWATALLSPPTANRALPVRVYLLAAWLASGAVCLGWGLWVKEAGPVIGWAVAFVLLFSFHLLIASGERDKWGPRVTRRIPRNPVGRLGTFLLYSGAAGGITFAALGGVLSTLAVVAWYLARENRVWDEWWAVPKVLALIVAYTYCYCLSATILRWLFRAAAAQPAFAWVAAVTLFILGCVGPFFGRYILYEQGQRYSVAEAEAKWMTVTNPVLSVGEVIDRQSSDAQAVLVYLFVGVWAAAVSAANVPWFLRQWGAFRRLTPARVVEPAEPEPAGEPAAAAESDAAPGPLP